jgi:hypothetical protein
MLPACLLALVAGYADTVGYLRYDAFAGLMTGNTILGMTSQMAGRRARLFMAGSSPSFSPASLRRAFCSAETCGMARLDRRSHPSRCL